MNIVSAVILCTIVGAVGRIILVLASKFMAVEEDPRIEEVTECLAGANCGGCGYAGCADYAKAVVMDGAPCDKCAPAAPRLPLPLPSHHGRQASAVEKKAVVQCRAATEHCKPAYDYKGIQTCAAAAALCRRPQAPAPLPAWALGDCTKACKFDAIHVVDGSQGGQGQVHRLLVPAPHLPQAGHQHDADGPASPWCCAPTRTRVLWPTSLHHFLRQYRIILSADTASEVRQMPSQKRR